MSKSLKQKLVAYGLVLPAFLVVMLTVAYPIISAIIQSFQDEDTGAWTLDNYKYFFTDPAQVKNILYTLYVVILTVVIALVVAYLLALYLRFVHSGIAKSIGTLYLLPRFVPAMCAVYAMITIIRDSGLINRIGQLFGLDIQLGLMYDASGLILMNLWFKMCIRDRCKHCPVQQSLSAAQYEAVSAPAGQKVLHWGWESTHYARG